MVHAIITVTIFEGFNVMILTTFFFKEKNQNNVNISNEGHFNFMVWNVTIHKRWKYGFILFKFYNDGLSY
jgi:hypothetical protein